MFYVVLLFCLAFLLQYALTFLQMRNFNEAYRDYRRKGYRAAIGKFAGKFHAGSIVMFAIDKDGVIRDGTIMQGVTVFARFKPFHDFDGEDVGLIGEADCKERGLSYSKTQAIVDCNRNYLTIMRGEQVPVPPSPIKKAGEKLTGAFSGLFSGRKKIQKT